MDAEGKCKCVCGYDANGELHVWDTYWAGLRVSQNDGPDDPSFCPNCDRELDAETVIPADATQTTIGWKRVTIEGDLQLAVAIDDEFLENFIEVPVLMPYQGGKS